MQRKYNWLINLRIWPGNPILLFRLKRTPQAGLLRPNILWWSLKTLFNIVEERFNFFELWCQCCIMMFRKVNKQPGMQKFWNWCSHYQEIYDWISPLNKRAGSAYYSNTVVYGEHEYNLGPMLHKKIVGIKAKSKSKIRIKPNLESNLNRVA